MRCAPRTSSTWRGAWTTKRWRGGRAPYSTVSAEPAKWWLNHIVMVPWHSPPQSRVLRGSRSARATRRAKPASLVSVSTPTSGWWKLSTRRGSISRRNLIIARVSGSLPGRGPDS